MSQETCPHSEGGLLRRRGVASGRYAPCDFAGGIFRRGLPKGAACLQIRGLIRRAAFAAAFLSVAIWATPSVAANKPVVVHDDMGTRVTLTRPAQRIISLVPSDTQILLSLGLIHKIAGVDADSRIDEPPSELRIARTLPCIGNTYSPGPNLELIAARRPDLILSSTAIRDNAALRRLGVPVSVPGPSNLAGIEKDVLTVGKAAGASFRATKVVTGMRQAILRVQVEAKSQQTHPTVFVELGYPQMFTVGPGSFIDTLLRVLDVQNVADQASQQPYPQIDAETLLRLNPQVIVLDDSPYATPTSVAARPGFSALAAVQTGRVYGNVNPSLLSQPGPGIVQALAELYADFYPSSH